MLLIPCGRFVGVKLYKEGYKEIPPVEFRHQVYIPCWCWYGAVASSHTCLLSPLTLASSHTRLLPHSPPLTSRFLSRPPLSPPPPYYSHQHIAHVGKQWQIVGRVRGENEVIGKNVTKLSYRIVNNHDTFVAANGQVRLILIFRFRPYNTDVFCLPISFCTRNPIHTLALLLERIVPECHAMV
jgi:hypothetical protein